MRGDTQDASARLCVARPHRWDEWEGQRAMDWGTDLHSIQVVSFPSWRYVTKWLSCCSRREAKLKMKMP